ncbi:MAG TPA: glycosyltransferase, partial [Lamprocystis sp. (in: g-proteobacteria)]|nr:glycosyltransferase [Lamprocystis sp. (in: g-proteobacteria)]
MCAQLPRARHVWRSEGPAVLLRKLRRRLRTTAWVIPRRPALLPDLGRAVPPRLAPVADPRVSVIVPVFNQLSFTWRCLAALQALPDATGFEVIVVDDGSTDGTAQHLAEVKNLRYLRHVDNQGFVPSCNRGAISARGDLLVFLNNDTQVQPGWLDALVATFEQRPDAGLVGSRLIYPDGRQQEAGGILFADGSAWSYGHLDDPYKPEYSYLREADYCSGAALAIPRAIFEQLGGFDRTYAPAYYEDTDLAMRVRAAGYGVYYQPQARVVHFEGVSAGKDRGPVSTGMKRFQAINRERFLARWATHLTGFGIRGQGLERAKERRVRRRALVVDNYMLTPDKESGSLRMVHLIAILQGFGYKVTFAAANLEAPEPYCSQLQMQGVECLYRPYTRSIARHLAAQGRDYDLVILSRADAAAQVMRLARQACPKARVIFDTVDLHFVREARAAALTGDRALHALALRRKAQELRLVDAADATLVVSTAELAVLRSERPQARLHCVSNIHRVYGSARPVTERRDLLFIGAFAHPPNIDAVDWLARDILPLARATLPMLHCHVIGADPPARVRALAGAGLTVHGYVPDVVPFFSHCRLSVAPLRYGAGVKGKINQSLAHGLPVVATTVGVEGMHLVDGESVLIADAPAAFAAAIVRLCTEAVLWERL